jgi:acetylornithine deacetylase
MHAIVAVVRAEARRRDRDTLDCLRSLLASSRDGEEAVQAEVAMRLGALGYAPRLVHASGSVLSAAGEFVAPGEMDPTVRTSVVGRWGGGQPGRRLMLWAHPDGPPFDATNDVTGWTREPFAGEIHDGRIYGWGIADDLSGVAAMLMTADILHALGVHLAGDLVVASTPSKGHAAGVLAVLDSGERIDAARYLHPAESGNGLGDIKALAPGMVRFRLRVTGTPPQTAEPNHALFAHESGDAIERMRLALDPLHALNDRRMARLRNDVLERFTGRPTSMLVSIVHGGQAVSRVALACEAVVTCVTPPGEVIDEVRAEITRTMQDVAAQPAWAPAATPEIDWLFGTTGV